MNDTLRSRLYTEESSLSRRANFKEYNKLWIAQIEVTLATNDRRDLHNQVASSFVIKLLPSEEVEYSYIVNFNQDELVVPLLSLHLHAFFSTSITYHQRYCHHHHHWHFHQHQSFTITRFVFLFCLHYIYYRGKLRRGKIFVTC